MRRLPTRPLFLLLLAVVFGMAAAPGQVQPRLLGIWPAVDAFFDDSVLQEIRLSLNSKDWQTLKDRFMENTYYPSDFRWRDHVVRNVGIRSRGTGSRSGTKPGLGVSFDKYTSDQKFLGLKSVVLRNNTQDPSNMNERLSMLLFQRMGMPVSREAYAKLFVNEEYLGLYTIVESIDKNFLKRTFDEDSGYLYEFDYPADAQPYYFEYRGSDPSSYVPLPFKPQTHESDPRPENIEQLIWTINETSTAVFRTAIAEYLDIEAFIRHVALDDYMTDNDGLLGDWGMNNFYLYRFDGRNLFTFLTWDKSEAFKGGPQSGILHNIAGVPSWKANRLITRAFSYPDLYALYLDTLTACARSTAEPSPGATTGPGWLEREIAREYDQIHAAALADPVKPYTNDEFEGAVRDLVVFAQQRGEFVNRSVAELKARAVRVDERRRLER
jgi:hypothetical protein